MEISAFRADLHLKLLAYGGSFPFGGSSGEIAASALVFGAISAVSNIFYFSGT